MMESNVVRAEDILTRADVLKRTLDVSFRDKIVEAIYADAEAIAGKVVRKEGTRRFDLDQRIDRIVTSRIWGLPLMGLLLAGVFWVTIVGANVPSQLLATGEVDISLPPDTDLVFFGFDTVANESGSDEIAVLVTGGTHKDDKEETGLLLAVRLGPQGLELGTQCQQRAVVQALDRALGTPEHGGDLGVRQALIELQDKKRLPRGLQSTDGRSQLLCRERRGREVLEGLA